MKTYLFLPLFQALCTATAVHSDDTHSSSTLVSRVNGQELTNPDNEPDYADPVTNNRIPKSRILKINEPPAAVDRWFDWDETCTDELDRQRVTAAFQDSMELIEKSSEFLEALQEGLPKKPIKKGTATKENVQCIVQEDPAFTQMFYAQDHRVGDVKKTFENLLNGMKSFNGRNKGLPDAVRFICDPKGVVQSAQGRQWCREGTQAATTNAVHEDDTEEEIEDRFNFETSASIVFCPPFFEEKMFPNIWTIASDGKTKTLDQLDCRERIMIHEWLHLKFTSNIGKQSEEIGFERAAKVAGKRTPRKADWAVASKNCDNYAWYALYAYWNNNDASCKQDVWPDSVKKPNKP